MHFFFWPLPLNCGVAASETILLWPVLSWTSPSVIPNYLRIDLMSRLTQSIHLCFGLPLHLLPGGTVSSVCPPTQSWRRLFTCPNHLRLAFLNLSVMFPVFSFSLLVLTWSLSMSPHAHPHVFISDMYSVESVDGCGSDSDSCDVSDLSH